MAAASILLLSLGLLAWCRGPDEVAIAEAVARRLDSGDKEAAKDAARELCNLTGKHFGYHSRVSESTKSDLGHVIAPALGKALHFGDRDLQVLAAGCLRDIGHRARGVGPELCEALKHADVQDGYLIDTILQALHSVGDEGCVCVDYVRRLLTTPECSFWVGVLLAGCRDGEGLASGLLVKSSGASKIAAMYGLRLMRDSDPARVARVLELSRYGPELVRMAAIDAMVGVGVDRADVDSALLGFLDDQVGPRLQDEAIRALGHRFAGRRDVPEAVLRGLTRIVISDSADLKVVAAWALAEIGRGARSVIPVLRDEAERQGNSEVGRSMRSALGRIEASQ